MACTGSLLRNAALGLVLATAQGSATQSSSPSSSEGLPPRDEVWIPARDAMQQALRRLENFSCVQNITRTVSPSQGAKGASSPRLDRVRLQVTHIGGEEYYSFPGDTASVADPHLLVKTGLSGTGAFMGYAQSVFLKHPFSRLQLEERAVYRGDPVFRFSFVFDQLREKLNVSRAGGRGSVGAQGEFAVGAEDSLLRWMRISSTGPLPELGIQAVAYEIHWSRLRGREGFLLIPEQASVSMELFTGELQRNEVVLSQCREFQTESALSFGTEEEETAVSTAGQAAAEAAAVRANPIVLPEGLTIALRLTERLDLGAASVGDMMLAELTQPVAGTDGILIPAGAIAEGRIRRLDRVGEPSAHTVAWLELTAIRDGNRVFLGLAELQRRDRVRGLVDRLEARTTAKRPLALHEIGSFRYDTSVEEIIYPSIPGVGAFLFEGTSAVLPAGYQMTWRTLPSQAIEKDR